MNSIKKNENIPEQKIEIGSGIFINVFYCKECEINKESELTYWIYKFYKINKPDKNINIVQHRSSIEIHNGKPIRCKPEKENTDFIKYFKDKFKSIYDIDCRLYNTDVEGLRNIYNNFGEVEYKLILDRFFNDKWRVENRQHKAMQLIKNLEKYITLKIHKKMIELENKIQNSQYDLIPEELR